MTECHRAARIHRYGGPEVLSVEDAPRPAVGPHHVLIEVHASSVNPIDWKIRQGFQRGAIRYSLPQTLGLDLSGVVLEVGSSVQQFRVGDEVFSSPSHRGQGTYAELCAVHESEVALKPASLSHAEAASLPLCALTAWDALVRTAKLRAEQRVLIQAGAGGVGSLAIQLAKAKQAFVATTCSATNEELCRSLGADVVIDRKRQRYDEVLSDYDVVLDSLGGVHQKRGLSVLKPGGMLVTIVSGLPENTDRFGANLGVLATGLGMARLRFGARVSQGVRARTVVRKPDGAALARVAEMVENEAMRPVIHRRFPLAEIADAHRCSEAGSVSGKIVIDVR